MTIEREMRGVERDVSVDECADAAIRGTDEWPESTPKQTMMNEEKVGVLVDGHSHRGFTQVNGRSDATDFAGVCDLQPVHRLWRIGDFFGYAQIVVEIVDERVESHSRHRNYSIAPASGSFHTAGEAKMLKYNELDNPHYENAAVWISPLR